MTLNRRALSWAFAAVLAVAIPTVHAADNSAGKLLSAQLPSGVTLAKASIDQTAAATRTAVAQRPDKATAIVQAAIVAKTPKQGRGKLSCDDVAKIVRAAISSAPSSASQVVQMGASLQPDCADALNNLMTNPDGTTTVPGSAPGSNGGADEGSFGVGFGTGFPGSPGFVGSAPSGAFALPPSNPVVTSTTNR